ncbi:MAG: rhodanese-like domain-containing protein [Clostridiaceae bacterium]|nr:rhodanese-like domain-containing protein [Clostridiaceae bacterium]
MNIKFIAKKSIYLIVTILMIGAFSGCSNKNIENKNEVTNKQNEITFKNITPEEAKKRLDSEKEIILLDVRTKEEYETGHIEKSILMPVDTLEAEVGKNIVDKEAIIFVYCRSGNRSAAAANILVELGYKNVHNLVGGITNWPYEVVK